MPDIKLERIANKIQEELGPINDLIKDETVIDIMYNPDGRLWTERYGIGKYLEPVKYPVSKAALVIRSIASYNNIVIGEEKPLISATLPTGQRFQGFINPVVEAPAFSIRCNRSLNITLDDYIPYAMTSTTKDFLSEALGNKENIILSGGTGSGKTTFCNALLDELYRIAPDDRIALMEEVPEIQLKHKNIICERMSEAYCPYTALLRANLRANPDRIILGELRGGEALDLLKSWNTGHPGGVTTLHANFARSALTRFETMILESKDAANLNILAVRSYVAEAVNIVVQIDRKCGEKPKIKEIIRVENYLDNEGNYIITKVL